MSISIAAIVVAGLITAFWIIAHRASRFRKAAVGNGFQRSENRPPYLDDICKALFDGPIRPGSCYRGTIGSRWGNDSWILDVDKGGGDDPSLQVLITEENSHCIPAFAVGVTDGIDTIGRLFRLLNRMEKPFSKAGFHLLPEPFQPFLMKQKGVVVYATSDFDVQPLILPHVIKSLRSGGYGGAAWYRARIVVWTYAQANPEKLFIIAKGLRDGFRAYPLTEE